MNYKVTFYKDKLEFLTERKSNFVNQLKKITSRLTTQLADKIQRMYGLKGTVGERLIKFLNRITKGAERGRKIVSVSTDIFKNLEIPSLEIESEPIQIVFTFQHSGKENEVYTFETSGDCYVQFYGARKRIIRQISILVKYTINELRPNDTGAISDFLNALQSSLVHQIAHANDENTSQQFNSYNNYDDQQDDYVKFFNYMRYFIKPTEIRSHMNQVVKILSSKKHATPERRMKNMYKTSYDSSVRQQYPTPFTDRAKNFQKQAYGYLKKSHYNKTIDEKSKEALLDVIYKSFRGNLPNSIRQFIFQFHISFVRNSDETMKQRYYDKLFPNTECHELWKMEQFFQNIKYSLKYIPDNINKFSKEIWDNKNVSKAFQECDYQLLLSSIKELFEN